MLRLLPGSGNVDWTEPARPIITDKPTLDDSHGPWEATSAGGGTALIQFADQFAAEAYCRRVEQAFVEKSGKATVTWFAEALLHRV